MRPKGLQQPLPSNFYKLLYHLTQRFPEQLFACQKGKNKLIFVSGDHFNIAYATKSLSAVQLPLSLSKTHIMLLSSDSLSGEDHGCISCCSRSKHVQSRSPFSTFRSYRRLSEKRASLSNSTLQIVSLLLLI